MTIPLRLSDSELDAVMRAAAPIEPASRGAFLEAVAARLARTSELGEGVVFRICAELQRQYFSAPSFNVDNGASRRRASRG